MDENKNVTGLIADSRFAFMQGKYEESLRLAKQAILQKSISADAHQCAGNAYMSKADSVPQDVHRNKGEVAGIRSLSIMQRQGAYIKYLNVSV